MSYFDSNDEQMNRTIRMIEDYTSSDDDENGLDDLARFEQQTQQYPPAGYNVASHPSRMEDLPRRPNLGGAHTMAEGQSIMTSRISAARGRPSSPHKSFDHQRGHTSAYQLRPSSGLDDSFSRFGGIISPHAPPVSNLLPQRSTGRIFHENRADVHFPRSTNRPTSSQHMMREHPSTMLPREYSPVPVESPLRNRADLMYDTNHYPDYSPTPVRDTAPHYNYSPSHQHHHQNNTQFFPEQEVQAYTSDVREDGPSHVNPVTIENTSNLKSINEVDRGFRNSFPFQFFNRMQSECFEEIYRSDGNICVAAPTSSGKTVLFKLAMIRVWEQNINGKCVYIAPTKSLCQQKVREFSKMFSKNRKRAIVREITGDTQETTVADMLLADVIVTTPEKFDSVTRSWNISRTTEQLMRAVRLVCIDEVHLLNENRGHCLEALVSRLKSIAASISHGMRVVAASATIPNLEDIGDWLGCSPGHRFAFGEEYRPVPLETHVIGYPLAENQNMFVFQRNLSSKLLDIIIQYSEDKPTLVFCATRKETVSGIDNILHEAESTKHSFVPNRMTQSILNTAASRIQNAALKKQIKQGCAHHSAGLSLNDRSIVEDLFLQGHVKVLCSTTTLALGVNLPARLVIVKGTQGYTQGAGYQEYDVLSILQMLGRSGRPQFDNVGRAVIMTTRDQKPIYDSLVHNQMEIESNFQDQIISHLNSEILCNSITDISEAITWIESTFYFVRIQKNPVHYGLESVKDVQEHIRGQIVQHLNDLEEYNLIDMDETGQVSSTDLGAAMSKFYISFETMKTLAGMQKGMTFEQMLILLCRAQEFEEYSFRRGEKKILNEINKNKNVSVYKVKGRITHVHQKVLLLLEAAFADYKFDNGRELAAQVAGILRIAPRVARCMKMCAQVNKHYECLKHCITLEKCLKHSLWPDSKHLSRQLKGIGAVLSQKLANSGYTSIQKIAAANPLILDRVMGRQRLGSEIIKRAQSIPKFDLEHTIEETKCDEVVVVVKINRVAEDEGNTDGTLSDSKNSKRFKSFDNHFCIVAGNMDGELVFFKRIDGSAVKKYTRVSISLPKSDSANHRLEVHVVSEMYLGLDFQTKISIPSIRTPAFNISPQSKKAKDSSAAANKRKAKKSSSEEPLSPLQMVREKAKTLPKTPASSLRKRLSSDIKSLQTPPLKKKRVSEEAVDMDVGVSVSEKILPQQSSRVKARIPDQAVTPPAVQVTPPQQSKRRVAPFAFPNAFQRPSQRKETGSPQPASTMPLEDSPQSKKARVLHENLEAELNAEMEWCDSLLQELSNELG
mmetsp:Transcript_7844/g.29349  ORF Transcript_7844/g.29349 Transcript_7844/m.29349 type:complete len:1296 (-) Transcript_7844:2953-6840(-)